MSLVVRAAHGIPKESMKNQFESMTESAPDALALPSNRFFEVSA